jgi:hypothetical protein
MTMHTETHCPTLDAIDKVQAIRAIHQAWLQLNATKAIAADESFDNAPALASLAKCLADAGHPGFQTES